MKKKIALFYEYSFIYSVGALLYGMIEILWRGHTHWTMPLTGGLCLSLLNLTDKRCQRHPLLLRCLVGTSLISFCELSVGLVVNCLLGWGVWDYSKRPFNLFGQICPLFCFFWFLLCIPAFPLCAFLRRFGSFHLALRSKGRNDISL